MTAPSLRRRAFIGGAIGVGAICASGCLGHLRDETGPVWPSVEGDPNHTGWIPGENGPSDWPSIRWRTDTWGSITHPVIAPERVVVGAGLGRTDAVSVDRDRGEGRWRTELDTGVEPELALADGLV